MENAEREILELVSQSNIKVKRLYDEHKFLDQKIAAFQSRKFLSSHDESELKELKSKKLRGKRMLMDLIDEHRGVQSPKELHSSF